MEPWFIYLLSQQQNLAIEFERRLYERRLIKNRAEKQRVKDKGSLEGCSTIVSL